MTRKDSKAAFAQCYSDVSETLLRATSHQFYPLHVTIQYFSVKERQKKLILGRAMYANFPTEFDLRQNTPLFLDFL